LTGIFPYEVFTIEEQAERIKRQFEDLPTPLLKYAFLSNERAKNEQSFWKFLSSYSPTENMPVLSTPTVGEACQKRTTYRASDRGIYIRTND
jgi:malate dehydrogenase (oxaloacetate-decarboxylating)/malate dehydrogenase (oxaloacetate-decarboxylating)(NADP+)